MKSKRYIWIVGLALLALLVLNVISSRFFTTFDLTEDKRFSLTKQTSDLLEAVEYPIKINVLLDGKLPTSFQRLQQATVDILDEYQSYNSNIDVSLRDPISGTVDMINAKKEALAKQGIFPFNLGFSDGGEKTQKQVYPFAILSSGDRQAVVNLLEEQIMGVDNEVIINNSISALEYKFSDAIKKLSLTEKPNVVFTIGRGELMPEQTARLERSLGTFYNTGRIHMDSIDQIHGDINVLIVAKPRLRFSDKDQFLLDQYVMNGGRIIWLIDYLNVNLDSLDARPIYVPSQYDLGLEDLWFSYGVRFQPNLVLDLECSRIPQVVGMSGGKPQTQLLEWPYHILALPKSRHPIVRNLPRMNMLFPSEIDTVQTNTSIRKTVLVESSPVSRIQPTPVTLNFQILAEEFDPERFNQGPQILAVLSEGNFESPFKNRMSAELQALAKKSTKPVRHESQSTKQMFISDGDLIRNFYNSETNQLSEIGYNEWERRAFAGNERFILNAVEYLLDDSNILEARNKEVKLRLLDRVKLKTEKTKWRLINLGVPLIIVFIFAFLYQWFRKRRYA